MDSFTVDASSLPDGALAAGSCVELIGPHQSADTLADAAGTIGYEILTSIGRRHCRARVSYSGLNSEAPVP